MLELKIADKKFKITIEIVTQLMAKAREPIDKNIAETKASREADAAAAAEEAAQKHKGFWSRLTAR